jgi:DNA-binding CsgD family transcriptional regulator
VNAEHSLVELAHAAGNASIFRERALALLCSTFEADVGIFLVIERGREVRTLQGFDGGGEARLDATWHTLRSDVAPVVDYALRAGVATDREVLGARLPRTTLYRRVMAPVRGTETLFIVPSAGGRPLALLALGRCGGCFSSAARAEACSLVPALSVASHALMTSNIRPLPRLTEAELDLLDYLELGWGTREIAEARGTSFFTVRNQLSALYRRLEVTNRAEAIGLRRTSR